MDGIAIQSNMNTARNTQIFSGRVKDVNGPRAPRKVLAEISNVQSNKAVTFDTSLQKPGKKELNRNILNTPGKRTSKPILGGKVSNKTPSIRSNGRSGSNSIKIYEDSEHLFKKPVSLPESDYDTPECKEYMAPCTDGEFEICLPDYVDKVVKMKPTFNIDYFSRASSSKDFSPPGILSDDDLLPMISNFTLSDGESDDFGYLTDLHLLDEDVDLLNQIDDSFSLERLDEEIRSAGLDVPW